MAAREKGQRHVKRSIFIAVLLLLVLFFLYMHIQAVRIVVKPTDLYLKDLPQAFDGARVLFVSDLNLTGDGRSGAKLLEELQQLDADLLLLGGDLSSADGTEPTAFYEGLKDFHAPLGIVAVGGENDDASMAAALSRAGVHCLNNQALALTSGGDKLHIVGLAPDADTLSRCEQLSRGFSRQDCVLALAHKPSAYVQIRVSEAKGGGAWADAVLSGHTLGGQIKLFGRTLREYPEGERDKLAGWLYTSDLPLLVSQGVRCPDAALRLGTQSEVHLICLRKPMRIESYGA